MKRVAIIGAGASGLIAAYSAGSLGASVTVFEKNEKPGKKIYITGKGRCNLTNASPPDIFFENIISNPKFMYKSFHEFNNNDLCDFIEKNGTKLKTERGNRVFPVSDHASDITKALINSFRGLDIKIKYNYRVKSLIIEDKSGVNTAIGIVGPKGEKEYFDSIILANGGATYPGAGGCMDGYEMAKKAGLSVNDIRPSLVPFNIRESYVKELSGLSLKNVTLCVKRGDKVLYREFGELLFTHFGISGPLVLTASSRIDYNSDENLNAFIDFKPAIPDDELDKRLLDIIDKNGKKLYKSFFDGLLPKSLREVAVTITGIDSDIRICDIDREKRKRIFGIIREFPMTITGLRGFNEAIITKGGVDIKQIDPKTMKCKKLNGLYICGELLDIDALTGGYNLQCAFSTGYTAGKNAGGES